jgi:hypothetical protein
MMKKDKSTNNAKKGMTPSHHHNNHTQNTQISQNTHNQSHMISQGLVNFGSTQIQPGTGNIQYHAYTQGHANTAISRKVL